VAVGAAPVIGYAIAFFYAAGYANVFDIPLELISVSVGSVFLALLALAGVAVAMGLLANLPLGLVTWRLPTEEELSHPFVLRARKLEPFYVVLAVSAITAIADWHFLPWWAVGLFFAWAVYLFVWPLISQRSVAGYRAKLVAQDQAELTDRVPGWNAFVRRALRSGLYSYIVAVLLTLFGAYYGGALVGSEKERFLVSADDSSLVIVAIYNDTLVGRRLNAERTAFTNEIHIWKVTDVAFVGSPETLGRLRVEDDGR
jgi:hypothetical protein